MYRVLSIDGGGIRGIIPAIWLQHLEQRIGSLWQHFDLFAGTSTGSILAAGLAAGIPTEKLVALYEEHGPSIFPIRGFDERPGGFRELISRLLGPKYEEGPLADVLKTQFSSLGSEIKLKDLKKKCLIPTYDVLMRKLRLIRSWMTDEEHIAVWEACKASCSAPTYFPAHILKLANDAEVALVDGGIAANNPCALALAEAIVLHEKQDFTALEKARDLLFVSMGTGNLTRPIKIEDAKSMGGIDWAFPILDIVFDGSALANDHVCRTILKDEAYFRFQVTLKAATEILDDASIENINELKVDALRYLEDDGAEDMNCLVAALQAASGLDSEAPKTRQAEQGHGADGE